MHVLKRESLGNGSYGVPHWNRKRLFLIHCENVFFEERERMERSRL